MKTEVLIVGGGIYGCATAYHLARQGTEVVLVESAALAAEASGGPGKRGVRGNRRDFRELPLLVQAYQEWPGLAAELGADTGYERIGGVYLVEKDVVGVSGGTIAMEAHAATQSSLGVPTEIWDRERVQAALPGVSNSVQAGIHAPLDGVASQAATTRAYAEAARAEGATIVEFTHVQRLLTENGHRISGVETGDGERIAARRVVLTNNAQVNTLLSDALDTCLPLWRVYPQALVLGSENTVDIPYLTGHDNRSLSIKMIDGDRIMLSGGWRGEYDPGTGRGRLVDQNVEGNIKELRSTFPELGSLEILDADASRAESVAVDQIPVIDEIAENLLVAAGWSGHGWALAPSASRHIARLASTGETAEEIRPFTAARFTR